VSLLLRLDECADAPVGLVGAKAKNLAHAARRGLRILDGWCLTTEALRLTLRRAGIERWLRAQLDEVRREPIRSEAVIAAIRSRVREIAFPAEVARAVRRVDCVLSPRAIVRSSAPGEDSRLRAYPGIFHSSGAVSTSDALEREIRSCWLSLFSPAALLYSRFEPLADMAVLIQPFVEPEWAGVLFSRDPRGEGGARVEISRGADRDVTDGRGATVSAALDDLEGDERMPRHLVSELRKVGAAAEEVVGTGADVEFAWVDGSPIVLQVRPMTGCPDDREAWCSQEDTERLFRMDLGRCAPLVARQLQKKVWYRRFCHENGIDTYRIAYLSYGPGVDPESVGLGRWLRTPHLLLNAGDGARTIRRSGLVEELLVELDRQGGERCCVQVGEVIAASATGYSAVLPAGGVRIEAFPMGLIDLKDGHYDASVYDVSAGSVVSARPAAFTVRASWSDATLRWEERAAAPWTFDISRDAALAIADVTRRLAERFGEIRLEWYWDGSRVSVKDLSVETRAIPVASDRVLSPGSASGVVLRIDDAAVFDQIGRAHGVSAFNTEEERARLLRIPRLEELQRRAAAQEIIVVADHASIGLIALIGEVRGFIFRRGNLLAHTAIALREHGIPGIVSEEAFASVNDGERVVLTPAGVERVRACE
jgi:phosphohistidine swiveling domain-containing protein